MPLTWSYRQLLLFYISCNCFEIHKANDNLVFAFRKVPVSKKKLGANDQ